MLEVIKFISESERFITTVFGLPFYKSSGTTSSASGTWFPFHGLSDQEVEVDEGILPIGYFIKQAEGNEDSDPVIPREVQDEIKEAFRHKPDSYNFAMNLIFRFNSLPCLLISSVLGGGVWEERRIKNTLKPYLMKKYPDFYEAFPQFEFSSNVLNIDFRDKNINKINQVNQWLIEHSVDDSIKNVGDLKRKDLKDLDDLKQFKPSDTYQSKI